MVYIVLDNHTHSFPPIPIVLPWPFDLISYYCPLTLSTTAILTFLMFLKRLKHLSP